MLLNRRLAANKKENIMMLELHITGSIKAAAVKADALSVVLANSEQRQYSRVTRASTRRGVSCRPQ